MNLPFSTEQFFELFGKYNAGVWPAQLLLIAIGLIAAIFTLRGRSPRLVLGVLAALWLWMGIGYHFLYFAEINGAATFFAAIFVLEGLYFGALALTQSPRFDDTPGWYRSVSTVMMLYAFVIYPLSGVLLGQSWPNMPIFGVPCPTTIFTMAVLLRFAHGALNRAVTLVPILWAVVATSAAISLGVGEDFALPVSALLLLVRLLARTSPQAART